MYLLRLSLSIDNYPAGLGPVYPYPANLLYNLAHNTHTGYTWLRIIGSEKLKTIDP